MDFANRVTHRPPPSFLGRMRVSRPTRSRPTAQCPATPRLDGQIALVTGGSRGIGLATSRGLAGRGAEVITASRREDLGKRIAGEIEADLGMPAHFVPLDLGDLTTISRTLDGVEAVLRGRPLDMLIANAGLWPTRHRLSAQGHEIAFATNVLGHHALIKGAIERGWLGEGARVVILTGDIYIMTDECTPDYAYRGMLGGQLAYCRSKLGNIWYARELAKRHPALRVHVVHPGVIASDLGGSSDGLLGRIKRRMMLPIEEGAQTSLFCATQPGLESGTYYHNVLGRVELDPGDPAADDAKARALWELVEELS
jgi:NAD(P)-dependent dehydrogenase (short-subunit alcohol dehydrogenase family)